MNLLLGKYNSYKINDAETEAKIIANNSHQYHSQEVLIDIFGLIDLTSLNSEDNKENIGALCDKVNHFSKEFGHLSNVAAVCIYPQQLPFVKNKLKKNLVNIAAVGAGFPSSQTFIETKVQECKQIVQYGADEIDIVISLGKFLEGNYKEVFEEIKQIKNEIGNVHLKVILETGALKTEDNIWNASILAMEAGADFIKTSTGKQQPAATLEAVYIMCHAIKAFKKETGKEIGIKPAGGISTATDALVYYTIIQEVLGTNWLNKRLFRIGASRLANHLLSDIENKEVNYF